MSDRVRPSNGQPIPSRQGPRVILRAWIVAKRFRGIMNNTRAIFAPVLLCSFVALATNPVLAQAQPERVQLILSKLPPRDSAAYKSLTKYADTAAGQILPLTKSEMWSVSRDNVDATSFSNAASLHSFINDGFTL
jgi:hypothetical protein